MHGAYSIGLNYSLLNGRVSRGQVFQYYQNAKAFPEVGNRLATCTTGSPIDILPLQVADLVAYECNLHIKKFHQKLEWTERYLFARIKERLLYNTYFDRELLNLHFGI